MIKKNAANSKILFVLFFIFNTYNQQNCKDLPLLGSAGNLLPNYLNQLFQTVYNSENEKILLISESIDQSLNQFFKIVFKISQDQNDYVYIGMIYKIQNNKGKITKFLQTEELEEIQNTLGIPKQEILNANVCKVDMNNQQLNTLVPENFLTKMQNLNQSLSQQEQSNNNTNEQKQVQSQTDQKQKIKVIESQDEGKIFIRKNPYNLGDVLSGSGENKIMNPVEISNLLITKFNQGFQEIQSNQDLITQLGSQLNMLQSNINFEQFQIKGLNNILSQNSQLQSNSISTFSSSN